MSDKERILLTIIRELQTMLVLARGAYQLDFHDRSAGREYVHFEHREYDKIKPGDLVICQTSGIHDFTVGFVVDKFDPDWHGLLLREIGTERTCRMSNERYYCIVGLSEHDLWEGGKHQFDLKVKKAFWKTNEDWYRFGGLRFNDDGTATMTVREKFGGCCTNGDESVPFEVTMPWNKRTSVKKIVEALIAGGVGTRKFERRRPTGKPAGSLIAMEAT